MRLIGGLVGLPLVSVGLEWCAKCAVCGEKVVLPGLASPASASRGVPAHRPDLPNLLSGLARSRAPRFPPRQLATGTWVAFTHGANDAQKTMA